MSTTQLLYSLIAIVLLCVLCACGQVGTLQGGPKDTWAPKLDETRSSKNLQTNFKERSLVFEYDEYVELKNAQSQIVVSPPLKYPFIIEARNKTVRFELDDREVLNENTTYTINFGKSIVDFTEGNPTEMQFVFSTGDKIDSLELSARLVDAETGEPIQDGLLILYVEQSDSIIFKEKPFYFGRSNSAGVAKLKNLRPDTFKVFALVDENLDYLYQVGERIGFLENDLITLDSNLILPDIRISKPLPPNQSPIVKTPYRGLSKFIFANERQAENTKLTFIGDTPEVLIEQDKDTLIYWLPPSDSVNIDLIVENKDLLDTVTIKNSRASSKPLPLRNIQTKKAARGISPTVTTLDTLNIEFNQPVLSIDTSMIRVQKDSTDVSFSVSVSKNKRTLYFFPNNGLQEKSNYLVVLDSAALVGHFNTMNDSILLSLNIEEATKLGSINLFFTELDSTIWHPYRLLLKDAEIRRGLIKELEADTVVVKNIEAGTYTVEVIQDVNKNGRWDPADYFGRKQPEHSARYQLDELRENWELESVVKPVFQVKDTTQTNK